MIFIRIFSFYSIPVIFICIDALMNKKKNSWSWRSDPNETARACRSISISIHPFVRPSVRPSVRPFVNSFTRSLSLSLSCRVVSTSTSSSSSTLPKRRGETDQTTTDGNTESGKELSSFCFSSTPPRTPRAYFCVRVCCTSLCEVCVSRLYGLPERESSSSP